MNILDLRDFSNLVNRIDQRFGDLLKDGNTKFYEFYNSLLESKNKNIEKINEEYLNRYDQNSYRTFKSRYASFLIRHLCKIDFPNSNDGSQYQKHQAETIKGLSLYYQLRSIGNTNISILILEKYYLISKKHDLTFLQLKILIELVKKYGLFHFNKYKYNKYKKELSDILPVSNLRAKVELYYSELGRYLVASKSYQNNKQIQNYKKELQNILKNKLIYRSYFATYYLYQCLYIILHIEKNTLGQIHLIKSALEYFSSKPIISNITLFSLNQQLAISLISLHRYNESIKYLDSASSLVKSQRTISWHNTQQYYFLIYILTENYENALSIVYNIQQVNYVKFISNAFREPWYLKEAFIHFLIRTGKINPQDFPDIKLRMFRLNRFLNEVPVYSKDKKGINITINIIQILFLLSDKKYDTVIDKLNSLKQYNHRYLRKSQYIRSNCFIKMLLTIPVGHFNKKLVQTRADKYYQKLLLNPMDYSEQSLNIEIIPYERLWEEVLSILE